MVGLPNLNALRAFEAAVRLRSFTRAAAELNVTQAAVSQRIRQLEDDFGRSLFRRLNREIVPTEAAMRYQQELHEVFARVARATQALLGRDPARRLSVWVEPSFAAQFLVPRLGRFLARHAEIDVRLNVTVQMADFAQDDVDLAVRHGRGAWPGLRATRLMADDWSPVCSPALLRTGPGLRKPADLRHYTLLHSPAGDWDKWFAAAGLSGIDTSGGPIYDESWMAIKAAVEGQGVALPRSGLIADELAAGRLVRPFTLRLPAVHAYYILVRPGQQDLPKVRQFADWLAAEAAAPAQPPAASGGAIPRSRVRRSR
ncbi:MAG: transcriptional regulator GcvA [Alphaproteobacteria bacterium]|nr:transcriptional regulator GcvA [Alphaproteobacteria bacterium]